MEDLNKQKKSWRSSMLDARRKLTLSEVKGYSSRIIAKLGELEPIKNACTIMAFSSIDNEVDLRPFINDLSCTGKTILLPRVAPGGEIVAVELRDWEQTRVGQLGVREPIGPVFEAAQIDAVLVPGLVFDANGYRLGYGKGYYDRFLNGLNSKVFKCGIAYEFQIIDNIFPHKNDIPVHWIVTERSEIGIDWSFF
ncbi:MAG: 5-formyltetrahydrofolate cyclo-ligase [Syntrophomonadaceae bacterium]|nr:5-formyltetrahydrofolate cyclo-ligase [Syntrophomonadaceae bacterium]MDD3022395.1 5-formyltetrahydrofolate cyclo-ligase [Syntrophomonadaceae bacterium]